MTAARRFASSYRGRLVIGYAAVVALFAVAWGWSLFGPLTDAVVEQQQTHLQSVAQAGSLALSADGASPRDVLRALVAGTELRATLVSADGTVVADSQEDPASMANHADRPEVAAALGGSFGRDVRRSATQGVEQMYVAAPATYAGGPAALRVSESIEHIRQLSAQARSTGLLLLGAMLVLGGIVSARLASEAARPVERLADAACAMASGDLTSTIPDEEGALRPLAKALADLRAQMRARIDDLEGEQRTLRTVLDGLDDAVLLLDGDRLRYVNRAATVLFRATATELTARAIATSRLPAPLVATVVAAQQQGEPTTVELGPDPLQRSLRVAVVPLSTAEPAARTLVTVSDVTERVRLDRMRRDFVTNASHELKTPTAGILLLGESAEHAASDGDTEQALAFVAAIREEAARLKHLVLDLLDLSRMEAQPDASALTNLRQAIDLSLLAHRRAAAENSLTLGIEAGAVASEDVYVHADATDVAIALDNLLANAIAYTERGTVTVTLTGDAETVRVAVTDTGIGIPAEDLPRVFERFYRVDRARSRDSGGTGLGLALVRHIMERWGGAARIESAQDVGTTVTLEFRRAR